MKRPSLVFASNNEHKLEEVRRILGDKFEIISLTDIGCTDDIPETADTLEGNALQKARYIHEHYGADCFADDTGLMVDALNGAPGVHTARYAGPGHDSEANIDKLLGELASCTDRKARFRTAVTLILDNKEYIFEGSVEGSIATERQGDGGFGYDPVFIPDESGKAFALMTPEEKNEISHRGRAMRRLADFLTDAYGK